MSNENLASTGRQTSRSSLSFVSNSIDDVLDKLKYLNYHEEFCKPNHLNPIHKFYFQYPDASPNEQFYVFGLLFTWLMAKNGVVFEKPGEFDDPNATAALMGIPFEFGPAKLKQGYGEGCIYVLQSLVDAAMAQAKPFQKPIHTMDDYPEEADVDYDAEVTTETMEEVEANQEDDDIFLNSMRVNKNKEVVEYDCVKIRPDHSAKAVDPAEWRLEVERVAPLLKVKLANDNKDWRIHLQQLEYHEGKIDSTMKVTGTQLTRLHKDIEDGLEKITSREKYINSQFEPQIMQYKRIQEKMFEHKQKLTQTSKNLTDLTTQLSSISDDLANVKSQIDEIGNGMTDSKPLVAIKQGAIQLKTEIKQMNLRIGVIENTLLNAKLKTKGVGNDFAVQVLSFY